MKMNINKNSNPINPINPINSVNPVNRVNPVNPVNPVNKNISAMWTINTNITQQSTIPIVDSIILITQFYISSNTFRQEEIINCLIYNLDNPFINEIYLITENPYTLKQIGLPENDNNSKIKLINISARMKYSDAFNIVSQYNLKGYIIIANSDIFFDSTIENLYVSNASLEKKIYCLLRFEYTNCDLTKCTLWHETPGSQDTWIFHSNYNILPQHNKLFNFELGIPGCDNHITYLLSILGYKLYNEPFLIKTYHNHASKFRTYDNTTPRIPGTYILINPLLYENNEPVINPKLRYNIQEENNELRSYLEDKIKNNTNFILPRISGIENNFAYLGVCIANNKLTKEEYNYINNVIKSMKNNAGIKLTSIKSILKYSELYLDAFKLCDAYFDWDKTGTYIQHIALSHDFITTNFNKNKFWALSLDIFYNIHNNPWTQALNGKRLLIISPFIESMKSKLDILPEIYGVDLFPNCEFIFLKPPQTHAAMPSDEFDIELKRFIEQIKKIKDDFDIALCSCGGYANLVCAEIFKMNKSAIYVGGVLQMFFGIYGNRWLTEKPEILRIYMNKHWSRPSENEKPEGHTNIEKGCYW
jgi:hypothetical protein